MSESKSFHQAAPDAEQGFAQYEKQSSVTKHKPLVIYHGNCADGFSAAWCFWHKYGDECEYLAGVYMQPPPDVTGRAVYLVDFSYKRAVVLAMLEQADHICLIDHHKTALEDLAGIESDKWSTFTDLDRSGATLAWDFLFPNEPRPLLLGHIEDRDLWRFKLPNTREIQANVFSYGYTFEQWDKLMAAGQAELLQMTVAGAAIERKHHKDIAELVGACKRRMSIGGHDVPVASLPYTLVSDAAHLMAQGEQFAACYWDTSTGRVFGLRATDEGMDVSEVAKQYGGGGHAKAAGFTVPRDHELARA
jgi:oligoribonuclease NrnB/cAMP/cGMP phosphodiesterase (DHH superfamily)